MSNFLKIAIPFDPATGDIAQATQAEGIDHGRT